MCPSHAKATLAVLANGFYFRIKRINALGELVCKNYRQPYMHADKLHRSSNLNERNIPQLVIGSNVNLQHIICGITNTQKRVEYLFDFIYRYNLKMVKRAISILVIAVRQKLFDLTWSTLFMKSKIRKRQVPNDTSLSEHRYVRFIKMRTSYKEF